MTTELPAALMREGFLLLATVGGPFVVALLVVGLVVGLLQAATQINDPAIGFLPRLLACLAVTWLVGGWALERLAKYVVVAFQRMAERA
jgi:flagellar biosynthesis protein FliQ